MIDWNTTIIIASNGVLLAIATVIGKSLDRHWLERAAAEHQVRFSVLHERVANTIEELYARLDAALRTARATVAELEIGEVDKNKLAEEAYTKAGDFLQYLWPHRLYLDDDLAMRLEKLAKSLRLEIRRFHRGLNAGNRTAPQAPDDFWGEAIDAIEEQAKSVFDELRKDFQRIIGLRVGA